MSGRNARSGMRPRTVKPEFYQHYDLYRAERDSGLPVRVAYAGLWGVCDRQGRFAWKPENIKRDVLPFDAIDMRDVLAILVRERWVVQYVVGDVAYGWCPTMPVHQPINARESASTLPPVPDAVVAWYGRALLAQNMGGQFDEPNPLRGETQPGRIQNPPGASVNNHNTLQDHSREVDASGTREAPENNGTGTRADGSGSSVVAVAGALTEGQEQPQPVPGDMGRALVAGGSQQALPAIRGKRDVAAITTRLAQTLADVVDGRREPLGRDQWRRIASELVFAYWAKLYTKERSYLSDNDPRERKILQRMKENGDDVSELLYALDGGKRSPFLMGQNPDRTVYDGIETLLRDRAQVEKLAGKINGYNTKQIHPLVVKYAPVLLGLGAPEALRDAVNDARNASVAQPLPPDTTTSEGAP